MARGDNWYRRWLRAGDPDALVGNFWFRRWVKRGAPSALEGRFWFRRAVLAGEVETFDIFVDSVGGDDGNDGSSAARAFKTLGAAQTVALSGSQIVLARGSYWRESLDLNSLSGVVIDDYGDPDEPMPTIDTTDVADNGDFSATAETTNVHEIAWTHELDGTTHRLGVWEDGDALAYADDLDDCDATAGTFWYDGGAHESNPLTVYVHPKNSTDPTSDGKTYEISVRALCLAVGTACVVRDIFLDKAGSDTGVLGIAPGGTVERCILRWGGNHHAVGRADAGYTMRWIDTIAYRQVPVLVSGASSAHPFTTFETAPAGGDILLDGCVAYDCHLSGAMHHHHTGGSGTFGGLIVRNCYRGGTSSSSSGGLATFDPAITPDGGQFIDNMTDGGARHIEPNAGSGWSVDGATMINAPGGWRFAATVAGEHEIVDACIHYAGTNNASGGAFWAGTTAEFDLDLSHCSVIARVTGVYSDDAETVLQAHDCVFLADNQVIDLEAAEPVTAADRNVYWRPPSGNPIFKTAGANKTGLAAWQTFSGLDAGSIEANPLFAGDPSAGDFSLEPNSPAFTGGRNAGARKWRTRPDWDALEAVWDTRFYAHPTDQVGGSQLVVRA
jgi:hypothetical protein